MQEKEITHKMLLDKIGQNSKDIGSNRYAINENRKAIEGNRKAIEVNRIAIGENKKVIDRLDRSQTWMIAMLRKHDKDIQEIKEKVAFIPKMYNAMDDFMKEIKASREGRVFVASRVGDHEDRITALEACAMKWCAEGAFV